MQNVETARRAKVDGLVPSWQGMFNAQGISIQATDAGNSDKAIADTVALMGTHAQAGATSIQVRDALQQAGCLQPSLTEDQVIGRVFSFVKSRVKFVEDDQQLEQIFSHPSTSQELLITPPVLLSMPQPKGDCDDFSMLVCSMLMAKGVQCDFVTVAANSSQPTEFSHVYCMARTREGRSIPIDASHGEAAGWETDRQFRKQVWPVFNFGNESRGVGSMKMRYTGPAISKGSSHVHSYEGLSGLLGDLGLSCSSNDEGDIVCDDGTQSIAGDTGVYNTSPLPSYPGSTPSSSGVNLNPILSQLTSIFGKIAVQTTQPVGTQQTVCNSQGICSSSSTVLPSNYSGSFGSGVSSFPSFGISGGGSILPWVIGGVILIGIVKMVGK